MNSTGKSARKRYGTRFSAKQRRESGSKRKGTRKVFGKLTYSMVAGNVPQAAVNANEALIERVARERAANEWEPDANVSVPGPRKGRT